MNGGPGGGMERLGPWTRLDSRRVYDNAWIRVREDEVLRPDGSPGIYGVVEFKHLAAGVVAVDDDGRVALVGQYRYPLREYVWEIPEGGCPLAEARDVRAAAARELREETGLSADRWDYLGALMLSNSVSDEIGHLFLARGLKQGRPCPEPGESLKLRFLPLEEAFRMVMEGELAESLTVAGIARAYNFLEKETGKRPGTGRSVQVDRRDGSRKEA